MRILIDENLPTLDYYKLKSKFEAYGINADLFVCKPNFKNIRLSRLSRWATKHREKVLLILNCDIKGKGFGYLSVNLQGTVDKIGGSVGIIAFQKVSKNFSSVCLHESLHLLGLNHCHNDNCIMGIKFKNRRITYPVISNDERELLLCEDCKGVLNGR